MQTLPTINADTITQAVIARHAHAADARQRELATSLVQHLHAFAREVRLTEPEWQRGLAFLAEAGQMSQGARHELALLSDTLGLSMLVAALNDAHPRGCTEATPNPPPCNGAAAPAHGPSLYVRGHVRTLRGAALPGAEVQATLAGGTARCVCDKEGAYCLRTALAAPHAVPHDGPVGRLLAALGRAAWRPAHLHFQVSAPGHRPLTTQVFREGSPHLDSDAVFAVRRSLVAPWHEHPPGTTPEGTHSREPFFTLDFDFVLDTF